MDFNEDFICTHIPTGTKLKYFSSHRTVLNGRCNGEVEKITLEVTGLDEKGIVRAFIDDSRYFKFEKQ